MNTCRATAGIFEVGVAGLFPPGRVRVVWRDEPAPPHPGLSALIARTWESWRRACGEAGAMLFNGQLARYLRHRIEADTLIIDAGPTDYVAFIGTNVLNAHRGDEFGWERFGNPIGTSATVITSDGWLLIGRRGDRVALHRGYAHTFGGGLEAGERRSDGTIDAFASIRRELNEELRLAADEIREVVCLGMIRDAEIRQPELIFDAEVHPTRAEVEDRLRPGADDEEHEAVLACRDEPDAILPFLMAVRPVTPVVVGAIAEHGRHRYGPDWYEKFVREVPLALARDGQ